MTDQAELVAAVRADAVAMAASLKAAIDGGVGPAVLLPTLVTVFKEAGLFSGNLSDLPMLGLPR